MARRTRTYTKLPWTGGVNSSVDPGMLNDNDLVTADNVVFATSGSRLKREGLSYFDSAVPTPDSRSSSGTTRTLYFTSNQLVVSTPSTDEKLVAGEKVNVTTTATSGDELKYIVTDKEINTVTAIAEVTDVQCVADSAGSLNNKYFYISAGDNGTGYYVWYNVSSGGSDPAIVGRTGVEVAISTNDTASAVASATQSAIDALSDFSATVSTDTVTVTAADSGYAEDASDVGTTGFTITITTQGGHSVSYTATDSLTESQTATSSVTVTRAGSVLTIEDYWRFDSGNQQAQLIMAATDDFKLYKYNSSGNREEVEGQGEVTSVTTVDASSLTTGDYWTLFSANDETEYYVWYNVASGGGDPSPAGKTGVEVAVGSSDTATQVATATASALDALSDFSSTSSSDVVTVTNSSPGATTDASDNSTGFTISVTTQGATSPTSTPSQIFSITFNGRCLLAFSGYGDKPVKYRPEDDSKYQILGGNPPDCSFMVEYQGRLWTDDKTDPARIHYSSPGNHEEWQGSGDSGALDFVKDGDSRGITAIFPYKGILYVTKGSRTYRITGSTPETYKLEPVSSGIGCEGQGSVVDVDQDDVIYCSRRGFHAVSATEAYGDTKSAYISAHIQPDFNEWNKSRLRYIQGAYVPELNSVAFAVSEDNNYNDNVWLFNPTIDGGVWYRWPNINAQALTTTRSNNRDKLTFGTNNGRIIRAQNGDYTDFDTVGISYRIKTGTIYPGGNPQSIKAFKKLSLLYKPKGDFQFTVKVRIDNFPPQILSFEQEAGGDDLGTTFTLGSSVLGVDNALAPFTKQIDGYGRGLTLEITQTGTGDQVEIYGFIIEFEEAGLSQEVVQSSGGSFTTS